MTAMHLMVKVATNLVEGRPEKRDQNTQRVDQHLPLAKKEAEGRAGAKKLREVKSKLCHL